MYGALKSDGERDTSDFFQFFDYFAQLLFSRFLPAQCSEERGQACGQFSVFHDIMRDHSAIGCGQIEEQIPLGRSPLDLRCELMLRAPACVPVGAGYRTRCRAMDSPRRLEYTFILGEVIEHDGDARQPLRFHLLLAPP